MRTWSLIETARKLASHQPLRYPESSTSSVKHMIDYTELPQDGVRFEQLVRELYLREGFDVRWTGVGPDGGRDLLVVESANGPIAEFQQIGGHLTYFSLSL